MKKSIIKFIKYIFSPKIHYCEICNNVMSEYSTGDNPSSIWEYVCGKEQGGCGHKYIEDNSRP